MATKVRDERERRQEQPPRHPHRRQDPIREKELNERAGRKHDRVQDGVERSERVDGAEGGVRRFAHEEIEHLCEQTRERNRHSESVRSRLELSETSRVGAQAFPQPD